MRAKDPRKAQEIVSFVNSYYEKHYRSPSLREIEKNVGFSRQTVHRYLNELDETGLIQYRNGSIITDFIRSIVSESSKRVALAGTISCGAPQMEDEWGEEDLTVFFDGADNGPYYALRAKGDSMEDAGIFAGDLVIVRKTHTAEMGDIVVALSNHHENTLKRLVYDSELGRPVLHPENKKYKDVLPEEIEIQGVAVHVIKSLI